MESRGEVWLDMARCDADRQDRRGVIGLALARPGADWHGNAG